MNRYEGHRNGVQSVITMDVPAPYGLVCDRHGTERYFETDEDLAAVLNDPNAAALVCAACNNEGEHS